MLQAAASDVGRGADIDKFGWLGIGSRGWAAGYLPKISDHARTRVKRLDRTDRKCIFFTVHF